jgi:nucleotide-binding universal stress UspA family protein
MLSHILVPLDGSMLAEMALEHARRLVAPNGKITLVTVVQAPEFPVYDFYPSPSPSIKSYETALHDALPRAKEYLERVAHDLEEEMHLQTAIEVEAGDAATVIVDLGLRLHVDAIVMSTHGRSGFSRWIFGSVTQKVLGVTPCPVFVVPGRIEQERKSRTQEIREANPAGK